MNTTDLIGQVAVAAGVERGVAKKAVEAVIGGVFEAAGKGKGSAIPPCNCANRPLNSDTFDTALANASMSGSSRCLGMLGITS